MRLFLGAHRAGLSLARIKQLGLLTDASSLFENLNLTARLVFDRLSNEPDRIDVLDLAASTEIFAWPAHRHIDVGAQVSFLHVAVAGAEIAQDRAQLGYEGFRLLGRADIGFRHDLHQRDTGAVEIDQRKGRMLVVDALAGILFEMQPLDSDIDAASVHQVDGNDALANHRRLVLADLVALR